MTLFRDKYRVESARALKWDYSSPGYYFMTICAFDRRCIFGEIIGPEMKPNENGRIVLNEWAKSFEIRQELKQDEFVLMPNHFHAIVNFNGLGSTHRNRRYNYRHNCCRDVVRRRDVARNVSTITNIPATDNISSVTTDNIPTVNDTYNKMSEISPKPHSLSAVIRSFKSAVTNRLHAIGFKGDVWQPRFHDHIIRNDRELFAIRQYIKNNPLNWKNDLNVIESCGKAIKKQPWFVYLP